MPNFVKVTFPNTGCTYEIPCDAIVAHRAQTQVGPPPAPQCDEDDVKKVLLAQPALDFESALKVAMETRRAEIQAWIDRVTAAMEETRALFTDIDQMRAWLLSEMTWEQIGPYARILVFQSAPRILADAVIEEFYDDRAPITPPANELQADVPSDMIESMLRERDGNLLATTVNGPDGQPRGAFLYVRGNSEAINAYLNLAQQLSEQLKKYPDGVIPPRKPYNH